MNGSGRARPVRAAALLLLTVSAVLVGARPARTAPAPPVANESVIVQFATAGAAVAQTAGGAEPTLAARGYERLSVPAGMTKAAFLEQLRARGDVVSAEDNGMAYAAAAPNDPYYSRDQSGYLSLIGVEKAWDLSTGGSGTVVVAVLDSGIDLAHEEFQGRLWENPRDADGDGIDSDGNGCIDDRYGCRFLDATQKRIAGCGSDYASSQPNGNVKDDNGRPGAVDRSSHGTLVAGVVGAAGNNGRGVTGVAWNVKIMPVKVLDCGVNGEGPAGELYEVAQGIDYARRMGANIISLSLGSRDDRQVVRDAIQAAQRDGVIVVVAAGNISGDTGVLYPAAYTEYANVVAVGASTMSGQWATFSRYGPAVDFAAPGVEIVGPLRSDLGLANPYGRAELGGTSFSTPLVTGMFALMMARNSRLSPAEYIQIARDAASPAPAALHGQNWAGAGIINIGAAVARVPMSLAGSALKDWKDVPAGTEVIATVGGVECGLTTTSAFGPRATYALKVKPEAERSGCGAPGRTVQISIGGLAAVPSFPWGERDQDLGSTNRNITSVSPAPGAIVVQQLGPGWSNVAQLEPGGQLPNALSSLPSPWTALLRWDPLKPFLETKGAFARFVKGAPAYVNDLARLEQYDAYWVDGGAANVATLNPNPAAGRTITLQPGWNNFVYTGDARAVEEALSDIAGKYTQVLQYDNQAGRWRSHLPGQPSYVNDFGGLFKFQVYWVYMTAPGTVGLK